jgi:hypothetical protein
VCTLDGRIFRIDKGASSSSDRPATVHDFQLEQNYPNPFNGETVIPFHIRTSSHAVIAIYDILGEKVATLVDRLFQAGTYTVRWNAEKFASGVYTCRLTAGSETASRTILLQK